MAKHLQFLSLNVRGLRDHVKRAQIFNFLKKYHCGGNSFVFLQETHSLPTDEKRWELEWGSKIVFDHGNSKKAGVAILFPFRFNSDETKILSNNNNGHMIVTLVKMQNDVEYVLFNVYAPTQDKKQEQIEFEETMYNLSKI